LDIVEKIWAPLGKLFASPGVPSWLRAWNLREGHASIYQVTRDIGEALQSLFKRPYALSLNSLLLASQFLLAYY